LWTLLAAGCGATLTLGLRGVLKGLVADPLVRLWWLIDSLPQGLVWLAMGAVGAALALRTWLRMPAPRRGRREFLAKGEAVPQLAALAALIRRAEYSGAARRRLASRLARLAVGMRSHAEALPPQHIWTELRQGRWPSDPELRTLFSPRRVPLGRPEGYLNALEKGVARLQRMSERREFDYR